MQTTYLGQAEPATSFARAQDTVKLGESAVSKLLTWGIVLGAVGFMVSKLRASPRGAGPDAADELAEESRLIRQRVAKRKQMRGR